MATDKTSTITTRLPTEEKEAIERACKRAGITKSEYMKGVLHLHGRDVHENIERLHRENPDTSSEQSDGGEILTILGMSAFAIAALNWLQNQQKNSNQFTGG